ncbi:MAG: hypothetical protein IKI29_01910 [Clostridia bacterium]|nr:hypothetical protein [Clostridia bacterium]
MKTLLVHAQQFTGKSVWIAGIFLLLFGTAFLFCWTQARQQALLQQLKRNNSRLKDQLKAMQVNLLRQRQKNDFLKQCLAEKKENRK